MGEAQMSLVVDSFKRTLDITVQTALEPATSGVTNVITTY